MRMEPGFRPFSLGRELASDCPEIVRVVHVHEMRDFMRRQILALELVEHAAMQVIFHPFAQAAAQ